jgi:hypothetical protein
MSKITFPIAAGNSFDLPPVCVLTGQTDDVVWKKRRWTYYHPLSLLLFLILGILGLVIIIILAKHTVIELPYDRQAHSRLVWRRMVCGLLALLLCFGGIAAGTALMFEMQDGVGLITVLAGPVLALVLYYAGVRRGSPRVARITDTDITLHLPSPEAVSAIRSRLGSRAW